MKNEKEACGFTGDYITIFSGNTYPYKEYFKKIGCRYNKNWGWGLRHDLPLPDTLPYQVEAHVLPWELVGNGDNLKSETEIKSAVESILYPATESEFVGTIGGRIERVLTVVNVREISGVYGNSTLFEFVDNKKNSYVWFTTSYRDWPVGSIHNLRATVKDHKTYKNNKQTIISRPYEMANKE